MLRSARFARAFLAACLLAVGSVFAQPVLPAPQERVAAIGVTPLRAPLSPDFSPGAAFTLEIWIFPTLTPRHEWLVGKVALAGADPFPSFGLVLRADLRPEFSVSDGPAGSFRTAAAASPIPLHAWTHLAGVSDGTTLRVYINGTLAGTASAPSGAPSSPPGAPFSVGRDIRADEVSSYFGFTGYARQLRLWSVARSAAQIAASLADALPQERTGLVGAWPLDEAADARTIRDISGAGRDLTTPGLASASSALVASGPFYADTTATRDDPASRFLHQGALIDFDGDGDLDVVYAQINYTQATGPVPQRLRAFRNIDGRFTDVTDAVLGNVTLVHPRHQIVGDFNGDGRPDVIFVGHGFDFPPFTGEQSRLLVSTPDGRLVEDPARLPSGVRFTHNVAAADIDHDGDLDLFLCNVQPGPLGPRLYLNDGRGFFTENASRLPADFLDPTREGYLSSHFVDVNRDGWPDLVLGPLYTGQNELLMNDGTGRFVRDPRSVLPPKLVGRTAYTVNIESADFNGDGWPDLVLSTDDWLNVPPNGVRPSAAVQLLLNRGDGTFTDATAGSGLALTARILWTEWMHPVDFSGDGRPDLVLRCVGENNVRSVRLLENLGTTPVAFRDVSEIYPHVTASDLVLPGDVDGDGHIDFLSESPNSITLSRNLKPLVAGRLANLSVRSQAGTGNATLIAGFVLGAAGPAATPAKPLLVRAVGPTLSAFGVEGVLPDPALALAPLNGPALAVNDDWSGTAALKSAFASVGAFTFATDASRDAALLVAPPPGAYTAIVSGGSGVALVEIYDAGPGNTPRLTNVSARTVAGTGANALIAGFVIDGTLPKKLLIRAAGPTLAGFGVGGTLADPVLEIRPLGSATVVARNDDWGGTAALKAAFGSVAAFAFASDGSRDAALALELPPGAYTATVSGANATTGVALVEVYELP